MTNTFDGIWWSVELPDGWSGQGEEECATFQANPPHGALQISSARKDTGSVSDEDLKAFAGERVAPGTPLKEVSYGPFSGFSARYSKDGRFWSEWWLRAGQLMIYVTYKVAEELKDPENVPVERIVASLKPIPWALSAAPVPLERRLTWMKQDDFGKPDPEGFRTLLSEPFVEYQGMLFGKSSFDKAEIDRQWKTKSPELIQRHLNHVHLFLYAADINIQREWVRRLEDTWKNKMKRDFPHLNVKFHQDDNGSEVILTFWTER